MADFSTWDFFCRFGGTGRLYYNGEFGVLIVAVSAADPRRYQGFIQKGSVVQDVVVLGSSD